jgi:dolichol kinase
VDSSIYLLGIFVSLALAMDLSRNFIPSWNRLFLKIFRFYLKPHEIQGNISGATTLWVGLYTIYLLFPKDIFMISAMVIIFSDSMAAIIGRMVPFHTFPNSKSIGGSIVFMITAVIITWQYGNIPLFHGFLLSIIWAVSELILISNLENFLLGLGIAVSLSIYFQIF